MRHIALALWAIFAFGFGFEVFAQDSLSVMDHLGMSAGLLFPPETPHSPSPASKVNFAFGSIFLSIPTPSEPPKSMSLYSEADQEVEKTLYAEISLYTIEDRSIHAEHGHFSLGFDRPIASDKATLFVEFGTTYGHAPHTVFLGGIAFRLH